MHKGTFSLDKDLMKGLALITHISSNKFQSSGSSVPVYFIFFFFIKGKKYYSKRNITKFFDLDSAVQAYLVCSTLVIYKSL